jgi:hypothetical protein
MSPETREINDGDGDEDAEMEPLSLPRPVIPPLINLDDSDSDEVLFEDVDSEEGDGVSISSTQVNTSISRPRTEVDDMVTEENGLEDRPTTLGWMDEAHPRLPSLSDMRPTLGPRLSSSTESTDDILLPRFGSGVGASLAQIAEPRLTLPSFPSLDFLTAPTGGNVNENQPHTHTHTHAHSHAGGSHSHGNGERNMRPPRWYRESERMEEIYQRAQIGDGM